MDIEVSLVDDTPETVSGVKYYQIEDGWIEFKDDGHKAVVAYPEGRVTRIKRLEDKPKTNGREMTVNIEGVPDPAATATAVARRIASVAA